MKIEVVQVCVNYSDFLAHALPSNVNHVDRIVVVTSHEDKATQELCRKFSVDCYPTDVWKQGGDTFNKGRMINYGLSHLRWDEWILHLDADIVLPHKFRPVLAHHQLDPAVIYGMDRLNCKSYENWQTHKWRTEPQHQYRYMVTPTEQFPVGSRLLHAELGWLPMGFFQLFHATTRRTYPVNTGGAEHSDVAFAAQWTRRHLIPEAFCYHLESETSVMGANWQGRKTKPFGPEVIVKGPKSHYGPGRC